MLRYNKNILKGDFFPFIINIIPDVNSRPIRGVSCPHANAARREGSKKYLENSRITKSYHISVSSVGREILPHT